MRWKDVGGSKKVEDRRRIRPVGIVIGGGVGALILAYVAMVWRAEPQKSKDLPQNRPQSAAQSASLPANPKLHVDPLKDFVSAILGDTENVWHELFRKMSRDYREPHVVLFTGQVQTACGLARTALGPCYCSADEKVYIDLSFFQEMNDRYHAPGDFARAYVIAHEVGHHVQNLLGISEKVRARQRGLSDDDVKQLSVRLELQADFLAGAWAHHADKTRHILEAGDLEAALKAVAALGDDRHALDPQGEPVIGSLTRCWDGRHGTSEQRVRWFSRGFKTGDLTDGDTIKANEL
jgi:uncharacterized protein